MTSPTRMLRAALLLAPLGALALSMQAESARAADIVDTLEEQQQFSTFAKAVESAGMTEALRGEGPFTVFAPTDEAFSQLPQGATDKLMKEENQATLEALIAQHVVEGKEIMAKEVLGEQRKLTTLQGDRLTIDGINPTVLLVPTGLTITRIDDRVIVQREGVAVPATSLEVQTQIVRSAGGGSQKAGQQAQTGEQQTAVSEQGDMPMSPHQQQALATDPEQQSTQTGGTAMPSTKHQRQVLAESELRGEQKQYYQLERVKGLPDVLREATLVTADIQADNGVIHAIDRVLVPDKVLSTLESAPSQTGASQQDPVSSTKTE